MESEVAAAGPCVLVLHSCLIRGRTLEDGARRVRKVKVGLSGVRGVGAVDDAGHALHRAAELDRSLAPLVLE